MSTPILEKQRKIIHVDMDCFYAAIEIRDDPSLISYPVAVGGSSDRRGVICTCNYLARQFGVRSAMPTLTAYRLCPDLIVLPVNMAKYKAVATQILSIFHEFSNTVEPLSLDEAYLDVSNSPYYQGSATLIAKAIRCRIWDDQKLTASAGVAPNKFLAKIASGWKKPNGLFVIRPDEIEHFIKNLPVTELFGVGKVTAEKMHRIGIKTCTDLQKIPLYELIKRFGKFGYRLYEQSRGIDERAIESHRERKSLSVEETFAHDIITIDACIPIIIDLHQRLLNRMNRSAPDLRIKNQFIKIKFSDFTQTTAETISHDTDLERYIALFFQSYKKENGAIRLLGLGVHFNHTENASEGVVQHSLF